MQERNGHTGVVGTAWYGESPLFFENPNYTHVVHISSTGGLEGQALVRDFFSDSRIARRPDGCWVWRGARASEYGVYSFKTFLVKVHQLAYVLAVGPIPEGHHIHHKCGHRPCVNPDHLECLTPAEHGERHRSNRCKRGHLKEGDNLRLYTDKAGRVHRYCRQCNIEGAREWRAMKALGLAGLAK